MRGLLAALALPLAVAGGAGVTPAPSLQVPRAVHTATLLLSGKVLIAGGCTVDSCELDEQGASTELYDPAANRFERGSRMGRPRVGHTATRLPSGDVLVAGGWDGPKPTASAELYEAATGGFVPVGRMRAARGGAVAALLPGGRVLIAGGSGRTGSLRSAEVYDSRTRTFRATGSMTTARSAHAAARLSNGRVLVVGGDDARERIVRSAELYDPRTRRFTRVGPLQTVRHKHAVVALPRGRALVLGGSNARDFRGRYSSAEVFDARTRRFSPTGRMINARFKLDGAALAVRPGAVLVAGGSQAVELYNVQRRRFGWIGATGARLAFATATLLRDGSVLFVGGYDDEIKVSRRAWLIRA
jgi:Kelch motif protein